MTAYNTARPSALGTTETLYVPYDVLDTHREGQQPTIRFFSANPILPERVHVDFSAAEIHSLGKTGLSSEIMGYDMEGGTYPPAVHFAKKIEKIAHLGDISIRERQIDVSGVKPEECIPALAALYGSFVLFGVSPRKVAPVEINHQMPAADSYGKLFGF